MIKADLKFVIHQQKVIDRIAKKRRRVLFRIGGLTKTIMKRSMRSRGKKRKKSKPGEPPRTIVGTIRRRIGFAVDETEQSVTIGPDKQRPAKGVTLLNKDTIPQGLDEGVIENNVMPSGERVKFEIKPRPFTAKPQEQAEELLAEAIESIPL